LEANQNKSKDNNKVSGKQQNSAAKIKTKYLANNNNQQQIYQQSIWQTTKKQQQR